jgi:hypothetical protein
MMHAPPFASIESLTETLRSRGYAVLAPDALSAVSGVPATALHAIEASWNALAIDHYLKDGGRYRRRRHGCFRQHEDTIEPVAHRAHWQPIEYNALHGGLERWFEPLAPEVADSAALRQLIVQLGRIGAEAHGRVADWFVEAHQFRIDTHDGIGRPTPEGAHRDGVDWVAVLLIARHAIKGGETRVFEADGPHGVRFTLTAPWSLLLLDDARMIHESTPIQPLDAALPGHRDTLVLTWRRGSFQGPDR